MITDILTFAWLAGILALMIFSFLFARLLTISKRSDLENKIQSLEQEATQLEQQNSRLIKMGYEADVSLKRWEDIKSDYKNLEKMKDELDAFEREESNRIDELEQRRAEIVQKIREAEDKLKGYPLEIIQNKKDWDEYIKKRMEEFEKLVKQIDEASKKKEGLINHNNLLSEEVARLEYRSNVLKEQVENEQKRVEAIIDQQIDLMKPENEQLFVEKEKLSQKLDQLKEDIKKSQEKLASAAAVETVEAATISFPQEPISVAIKEGLDVKKINKKLAAFKDTPACLEGYDTQRELQKEEVELKEFKGKLDESGLKYPIRIIKAFHTSLKVNDLSPLTVLSGLSGTGKSQLPKAYANYFGIHFLHVPVEPGWDSPQDLLGFYDFVSEIYRPTDRAKALGHFDSVFAKKIGIKKFKKWQNRMLLILLDEMNLARTEYYFSEFLSRLEMRGARSHSGIQAGSDARILIDLPYSKKQKSKSLYVPHNVLWVGTLNEDETTQTLSDKVLDRANSIRFAPPTPEKLVEEIDPPESIIKANGYLSYEDWLKWAESKPKEEASDKEIKKNLITLATLMQDANRGFGYRITQSIRAYIERYPDQDWRKPMIDQVNMRLLPKLSGCELNKCQGSLEKLINLCDENLGDNKFSEVIKKANKDSDTTQIFNWPGYTYDEST